MHPPELHQEIEALLRFFATAERLKTEKRHSWLSNGRQESVAEHSWMTSLMAVLFSDNMPDDVNANRVLQMIVVHDLAEAIAGDVPSFALGGRFNERQTEEAAAIETICNALPRNVSARIRGLWHEFEAGVSPSARYARALDHLEVQIQHNLSHIATWEPIEFELMHTKLRPSCAHEAFLDRVAATVAQQGDEKLLLHPLRQTGKETVTQSVDDISLDVAAMRSALVAFGETLASALAEVLVVDGQPCCDPLLVFTTTDSLLAAGPLLKAFPAARASVIFADSLAGVTFALPLPMANATPLVLVGFPELPEDDAATIVGYIRRSMPIETVWLAGPTAPGISLPTIRAFTPKATSTLNRRSSDTVNSGQGREVFQGFRKSALLNAAREFVEVVQTDRERLSRSETHAVVRAHLESLSGRSLLDFGCGDGALTHDLVPRFDRVIGYDPDIETIDRMSPSNGLSFTSNFESVISSAPFDVVNVCMVLHAVEDVRSILSDVYRVAAIEGRQVWTFLHPAFGFDEAFSQYRRKLEDGVACSKLELSREYTAHHRYDKTRGTNTFTHYHRPLGWYLSSFAQEGFRVTQVLEPLPDRGTQPVLPRVIVVETALFTAHVIDTPSTPPNDRLCRP